MNLNTGGWASRVLTPLLRIVRSSPNATVPVVVISEPVNSETAALVNADLALVAKGTGATLAAVPDGTTAGGNKRGQYATDLQKSRSAATNVASGNYSTILGGANNTASSSHSFIGGGQGNTAQTSTHATVAGGSANTASGQYAFVGGGDGNTASGSSSVIAGGRSCSTTVAGSDGFIGGGLSNSTAENAAVVCGGQNNTANGAYSAILGGRYATTRSITGYHVFAACSAPIAFAQGRTQSALLLLGRETTDATATVLTSDTNAASTTNQVILPNNSAYSFSGEVIAGVTGAGNTARWTINGAIKRGAGAGTTAMVGTPTVTMTHNDAGASGWIVNVTADTTNGGIKVQVTGAASTTIRWVAKINTTEMTF